MEIWVNPLSIPGGAEKAKSAWSRLVELVSVLSAATSLTVSSRVSDLKSQVASLQLVNLVIIHSSFGIPGESGFG